MDRTVVCGTAPQVTQYLGSSAAAAFLERAAYGNRAVSLSRALDAGSHVDVFYSRDWQYSTAGLPAQAVDLSHLSVGGGIQTMFDFNLLYVIGYWIATLVFFFWF